jgi:hypothetical protein
MEKGSILLKYNIIKHGKILKSADEDKRVQLETSIISRYLDEKYYLQRYSGIILKRIASRGLEGYNERDNTIPYLEQYYLRNNSESGVSADKRWFGWTVGQKRDDWIGTALTCTGVWHNLLNLYLA